MISIAGHHYNTEEAGGPLPADANVHEQAAWQFIAAWLRGDSHFNTSSSGATGPAKNISLSREQMLHSARLSTEALQLRECHSALVCLSAQYIAGKMMLVRALELGMDISILQPSATVLEEISAAHTFDFAAFVPLQLEPLLLNPSLAELLERFKVIIIGAAPLHAALEQALGRLRRVKVYHTYGMTETVSHIALRALNGSQVSAFYRPLPGVQLRLDERGCLAVQSPMSGPGWVQSNDLVELQEGLGIRFLGRYDNMINSGGVKISPELVEQKIQAGLQEAGLSCRFIVVGLPHRQLGEQVSLLLELEALSPELEAGLHTLFLQQLAPYERPRQIRAVAAFKEAANGKIQRRETVNSILTVI